MSHLPESGPGLGDTQLGVEVVVRYQLFGDRASLDTAQEGVFAAIRNVGGTAVMADMGPIPESDPEDAVRKLLNAPSSSLLADLPQSRQTRSRDALFTQGVETVLDVLVVGADKLRGFGEIGPKAIESMRHQLEESPMPFPLLDKPPIEYIAALCDGLDQVSVHVVGPPFGFDNERLLVAGSRRLTVADALEGTALFYTLAHSERMAARIKEKAEVFRDEFQRVKGLPL